MSASPETLNNSPESKEQPKNIVKKELDSLKETAIGSNLVHLEEKTKEVLTPTKKRRTKEEALMGGLTAVGGFLGGMIMGKNIHEAKALAYGASSMVGGLDEGKAGLLIAKEMATPENVKGLLIKHFPHLPSEQLNSFLEKFKEDDLVELHTIMQEGKDPKEIVQKLTTFSKKKNIHLSADEIKTFLVKKEEGTGTESTVLVGGIASAEALEASGFLDKIKEFFTSLGGNVHAPEWLKDLSIEKITSDLNIPNKEELDKLVKEKGYFGLLFGWAEKMKIDINMGQVVLMLHHGIKSGVLEAKKLNELVETYFGSLVDLKKMFNEKLQEHSDLLELLPEDFHAKDMLSFMLEESDGLVDWIAKNPYASSMVVVGGAALIKSPEKVLGLTAFAGGFIGGMIMKQAKSFMENPKKFIKKAGTEALIAGTLFAGRREYIRRLINILYDPALFPDQVEYKRVTDEATHFFNTLAWVDETKKELLYQYQIPHYVDMLIKEPLSITENIFKGIKEGLLKGDYSLLLSTGGQLMLTIPQYNAPIMLPSAAWETIKTFMAKESRDGLSVEGVTTVGFEGLVLFSAGASIKNVYTNSLLDASLHKRVGADYLKKCFWSFIPMRKEWWFVTHSVLRGAPGVKALFDTLNNLNVGQMASFRDALTNHINKAESLLINVDEKTFASKAQAIHTELLNAKKSMESVNAHFDGVFKKKLTPYRFLNHYDYMYQDSFNKLESLFSESLKALREVGSEKTDFNKLTFAETQKLLKTFKDGDNLKILERMNQQLSQFSGLTSDLSRRLSNILSLNFSAALAPTANQEGKTFTRLLEKEEKLRGISYGTKMTLQGMKWTGKEAHEVVADLDKKIAEATANGSTTQVEKYIEEKALYSTLALTPETFTTEGVKHIEQIKTDILKLQQTPKDAKHVQQLMSLTKQLKNIEQGAEVILKQATEAEVKRASAMGKAFDATKLTEKIVNPLMKGKEEAFEALRACYTDLPKELKTSSLAHVVNSTLEGSIFTKITSHVKGRAKIAGLIAGGMFVMKEGEKLLHGEELSLNDALEEIKNPEFHQLLMDILPVTGTFTSLYAAATGEQFVTGAKVEGVQNRVINTLIGLGSGLGDLALLGTMGTSLGIEVPAKLAILIKSGTNMKVAERLLELWKGPISKAAEKEGWISTLKKIGESMVKGKDATKATSTATSLNKWSTRLTTAGMGTMVGTGIYNYFSYGNEKEVPLAEPATSE